MQREMQETAVLGHVASTADLGESRLDVESDRTRSPCFSAQGAAETPPGLRTPSIQHEPPVDTVGRAAPRAEL